MRPLAMCVTEPGWGSSVPIDLFTAFALTSQRTNRVEAKGFEWSGGQVVWSSSQGGDDVVSLREQGDEIKADDQAIQNILLGLPEDIYAAVDSCEIDQEIWLRVQQIMRGFDIEIQKKKAKLFNEWKMFTSIDGESIESYYHRFSKLMNDFKRNKHFYEMIATDYTQLQKFLKYNQKEQASTSGTQTDKALVFDSDGSAEVHHYENCYNNDIFNMFTQKEQYTELLKPIPEPHQVQQNDSNVISEVSSVEQSGRTVDQHHVTVEETRTYFESLYNNLAIEVEKVNVVNFKLRETNVDLTTELARYKNQEKCFEISKTSRTF
nr:hypothetical protein [Tanacetum cinerariifolium]